MNSCIIRLCPDSLVNLCANILFGVMTMSFYDENRTDNTPNRHSETHFHGDSSYSFSGSDSASESYSKSTAGRTPAYDLDEWERSINSSRESSDSVPHSYGGTASTGKKRGSKYNLDEWEDSAKSSDRTSRKNTYKTSDNGGRKGKTAKNISSLIPSISNKSKRNSDTSRSAHGHDEDEHTAEPKRAHIENLNVTEKKRAQGIPTRADAQWDTDEQSPEKIRELTAKQRKIRSTLTYIGLFFVIVLVAVIFSVTIIFKTDNILVEGDTIYSSEEIIEASGLYYGENIFLSPKKAAAKSIVDEYPYIESAEITIKIPGTQIITVTAAIPSYEVSVDDGYIVVSSSGRILEYNEESSDSIPTVKGVTVTETGVGEYITYEKTSTQQIISEVIDAINDNSVSGIYGIDISNAANIKLNYDNRITIYLGLPEDVSYKLRTAMTIIEDELTLSDKGDLDVSLANSDRKSSYYTPYYSNTVSMDSTDSDTDTNTDTDSTEDAEVSSSAENDDDTSGNSDS